MRAGMVEAAHTPSAVRLFSVSQGMQRNTFTQYVCHWLVSHVVLTYIGTKGLHLLFFLHRDGVSLEPWLHKHLHNWLRMLGCRKK